MKIQVSPELEFRVALIPEIKHRLNNQPKAFYKNKSINDLFKDTIWKESNEGHYYWAIVNYLLKDRVKLEGFGFNPHHTVQSILKKLKQRNPSLYHELESLL